MKWSPDGVIVCAASGTQDEPVVVFSSGGAVVFWRDHRGASLDIYAQRIDATGVTQWPTDGVPLATTSAEESSPLAISDGASGVTGQPGFIALFNHIDTPHTQFAVRMQHVDVTGAGLWTPATDGGVVLASLMGAPGSLALTTDGVGILNAPKGAVAAWQDIQPDLATSPDIHANRMGSGGVPQWGNGVAVCAAAGSQGDPAIVNVGGGNTIVAWADSRATEADIYAQKLNSAGDFQWLADGLIVCDTTGRQTTPRLASDLAGGAIVAWQDSRSGVPRIYAQRIDGNGQRLWVPRVASHCRAARAARPG